LLNELYRYAVAHHLNARAGYKTRKVKAYLNISAEGMPPAIVTAVNQSTYAPDLGSKANSTNKCNPLVEKAAYVLNITDPANKKDQNNPVKHQFYLDMLESAVKYEPRLAVWRTLLADEDTLAILREQLVSVKLKPMDPIGLMTDGKPLEGSESLIAWWATFRQSLEDNSHPPMQCLITGEATPPLATVPKVTGLRSVGGHTSGDALLCFDKDAFTSYGFKQGENACVSETAMTAVNAALAQLLRQAPRLAGAKYVYFYQTPILPEEDPLSLVFDEFIEKVSEAEPDKADSSETCEELPEEAACEDAENDEMSEEEPSDTDNALQTDERELREAQAVLAAKALLESIHRGERPELSHNRYYIMPLSGAGGRMMIRGWMEGSFETLCENTQLWFDDLRLVLPGGRGFTRPPKLFALLIRLLKPQKGERKIGDRISKELSSVTPRIVYAILNNTPLPDTLASRALLYIRSRLLIAADDESSRERTLDPLACEILKAWLNRTVRAKGGTDFMNEDLNPSYQGIAYQLGRLMAVYAAVQTDALGSDLGAGVLQRYYASASTSPALVIGKLAQLSQHHLSKLSTTGSGGKAVYYSKTLQTIYALIHEPIPTTLSLMQQSEFALGYYQQRAALYTPRAAQEEQSADTDILNAET